MKNQNGFTPLIVILALVLVGGGTYAVVNRSVLKSFFQTGDKPTQEQTIDADTPKDGGAENEAGSTSGDKPTGNQFNILIDSSVDINVGNKDEESVHNLSPKDAQIFTSDEAMKPIEFRWTPLVPKPRDSATYRLKVWQLMQGQNGTQAMRSNKPIVEKDVMNTTETSVSGIYTGPCRPPYLCDFVWQVQIAGEDEMMSETTTFNVAEKSASGAEVQAGAVVQ
ncbi:hypothetical protein KBB85_06515 [Patescibacteria group bacterium]|nr:hypothetical protein [Patescibacteria group bacterium]